MTRESLPSKCGPPLRALNCKLHIYYCNGIKNKQLYIYKLSFEEQIMCLRSFECFIALFCHFIYEGKSNVSWKTNSTTRLLHQLRRFSLLALFRTFNFIINFILSFIIYFTVAYDLNYSTSVISVRYWKYTCIFN